MIRLLSIAERNYLALALLLAVLILNYVDAMLTNSVHSWAKAIDIEGSIEANPLMRPFVGTWMLQLKILVPLGLIWAGHRFRGIPYEWPLLLLALAMGSICLWNLWEMGLL
jgi:hypothetical protein